MHNCSGDGDLAPGGDPRNPPFPAPPPPRRSLRPLGRACSEATEPRGWGAEREGTPGAPLQCSQWQRRRQQQVERAPLQAALGLEIRCYSRLGENRPCGLEPVPRRVRFLVSGNLGDGGRSARAAAGAGRALGAHSNLGSRVRGAGPEGPGSSRPHEDPSSRERAAASSGIWKEVGVRPGTLLDAVSLRPGGEGGS